MSSSNHRNGLLPDDHVIVLFGATGDLAKRKLLPGLLPLSKSGLLPRGYRIVGSAPAHSSRHDWPVTPPAKAAVAQFGPPSRPAAWQAFESRLTFGSADPDDPKPLVTAVQEAEQALGRQPPQALPPGVPPSAFSSVVSMLGQSSWRRTPASSSRSRSARPESSRALAKVVHSVFDESQVAHRPLPRQGVGRQYPRPAVRQRPVRADLEP
jgi:glucose-6-phosphate 1-dehydrogenase